MEKDGNSPLEQLEGDTNEESEIYQNSEANVDSLICVCQKTWRYKLKTQLLMCWRVNYKLKSVDLGQYLMGETEESKNDGAAKVEKDQKHEKKEKDKHNEEENGEKDSKDKKKKDKDGAKDKKKDKNPQDKKDPNKLRMKLEKIETKMQDLQLKKDETLKMISEVESNAAHSSAAPPASA